ncbi:unnamed protein product [Thlaspi arvense]|uniref:Cullin N-terminal domain-containing protein n=1 Tax=Thlaspi arvense TaxID=13288 RepID=A0AAU9T9G2_THLAR|nr:unnamed protein product [Thlaspi arvense]
MSLPTKRSTSFSAASSSSSFPPMKKAKNGLQQTPQSHDDDDDNDNDKEGFSMEEDHTPAAANLSRKKATLPQPTKKLVIKLNKVLMFSSNLMEEKLYQQIEKECEEHISAALQALVGQNTDHSVFLSLIEKCWQDFCDQMLLIRSIALSLDRKYVRRNPNVRSLWEMGLQLFRKHLSLAPEVEQRTVTGLLSMIENERLGEAVNRTLLNHLLKMFTALGIYMESFEKRFL